MMIVEQEINKFLNKKFCQKDSHLQSLQTYVLYYKNQMSTQYRVDERMLREIFKEKVNCVNKDDKIQLRIYYQSKTVSSVLVKNNLSSKDDLLSKSNVVYKIKCPLEDCKLPNSTYIGNTQCSLSQRITMHLQNGSYRNHLIYCHNIAPQRTHFTNNVSILKQLNDCNRLLTYEAIAIKFLKPGINEQDSQLSRYTKLYCAQPTNEDSVTVTNRQVRATPTIDVTSNFGEHCYNTRSRTVI